MVRHEPVATIVQEALEGYACGRFQTQAEVMRFLDAQPGFPKTHRTSLCNERVNEILTRIVYAGYIDLPDWQVRLVPAKHEALIDYATYQRIQERLHAKAKVPARKDLNRDFPLRGAMVCGHCGTTLTGCWSSGSHAHYAYYLCPKKGCAVYGKSTRRDVVESEFASLLSAMRPAESLLRLADARFRDLWNEQAAAAKTGVKSVETDLRKIDSDIDHLMDRIVAAESDTLITAYERKIHALEEKRVQLRESIVACGKPLADYDTTFRTAIEFLANPCNLWNSPRLEDKRAVLKLAFADRLQYLRGGL